MDEKLKTLVEKVKSLSNNITNEEQTKMSCILPLFQILGYDVFNPLEFNSECNADVGIKQGEKVDYTVLLDHKPIMIIEAKKLNTNLENNFSQLFRYFSVIKHAKIAILTNGIEYRFYSDIEDANRLDEKPFFTFNLLDYSDNDVKVLDMFCKAQFNEQRILEYATKMYYKTKIDTLVKDTFANPDAEFISYFVSKIYSGNKTQRIIDDFTPVIKQAINDYLNDNVDAVEEVEYNVTSPDKDVITNVVTLNTLSIRAQDFTKCKIKSISIDGYELAATASFAGLYVNVFNYLFSIYGESVYTAYTKVYSQYGYSVQFLGYTTDNMRQPRLLNNNMYVNVNIDTTGKLLLLQRIIKELNPEPHVLITFVDNTIK